MNTLIHRPRPLALRPLLALFALLAVSVLAATLGAAPASAHDALRTSDPADGDTLKTAPEQITLTFTDTPLDVSPLVVVKDESGKTIAKGAPKIDGPTVTFALKDQLDPGSYDVAWRVASSDGHPIEGTFSFEVAGSSGDEGSSSAASDGGAASDSAEPTTAESSPSADAEQSSDSGGGLVILIVAIAVIAVIAVGAGLVISRRPKS